MVTIKTIAEKSGLSIAAVSKALNGRPGISLEKAEQVRQLAQELGYSPNAAAQMLKTNRSHNIGILFQNRLAHEFFSQVLEAIRDTAEARGYDITLLRGLIRPRGLLHWRPSSPWSSSSSSSSRIKNRGRPLVSR